MRNEQVIPTYLGWADPADHARITELGNRKEELYREIIVEDGIEPLPGVIGLLAALNAAGIRCAVGSSTPVENVRTIMKIIGIEGRFQQLVCAADVKIGKPDPEVFLTAARQIGREPANCVVFEDALVGIEAGKRAGSKVIAVATTNPIEKLSSANLAVASLEEITVDTLIDLVGA